MSISVKKTDVIIIGGGWAGLSAAIKLSEQGKNICIIESAKQLGGRAREVNYHQYTVDNGTHIMVGAYTETLDLIKKVNTLDKNNSTWNESDILERQGLNLSYMQSDKSNIKLPCISLPSPFNIAFSFLLAKGLNLSDKLRILFFGLKIKLELITLKTDLDLESFLTQHNQSSITIKNIWEPLCLAIMNTPIDQASAEVFLTVLKDAFFKSKSASDLIFFKRNLSETFPVPAQQYLETCNGVIELNQKAISIKKEENEYVVRTKTTNFQAKHIIIATTPGAAVSLLSNLDTGCKLNNLISNLNTFTYQPICTIYLKYPESIQCQEIMQGFLGTTTQWMFDKNLTNQPGLVSIIISSQGCHLEMDNKTLINNITHELAQFHPGWPQPVDAFVIREKRATFTASVNINRIRPPNKTDINNIWLAGDYTATQYPATLEGAVRSGQQCAQQILSEF